MSLIVVTIGHKNLQVRNQTGVWYMSHSKQVPAELIVSIYVVLHAMFHDAGPPIVKLYRTQIYVHPQYLTFLQGENI